MLALRSYFWDDWPVGEPSTVVRRPSIGGTFARPTQTFPVERAKEELRPGSLRLEVAVLAPALRVGSSQNRIGIRPGAVLTVAVIQSPEAHVDAGVRQAVGLTPSPSVSALRTETSAQLAITTLHDQLAALLAVL